MVGTNSPVTYVDQDVLNRLADKQSLDAYLKGEGSCNIDTDFRFLVGPKLKQFLADALKDLPKDEQRLIILRYWEDLSTEEIGFSLGVNESLIRRKLVKILAKLRVHILSQVQTSDNPEMRGQKCAKLCC